MTYDQAQSPRLGQRAPVESTYVQIVDVDPENAIADLPEAAWHGMLLFDNSRGVLMIWNSYADTGATWQDVAGGVAGQLTYVGTEQPTGTGFAIGDQYYDSDDKMRAYVWDGDSWAAVSGEAVYNYVVEYAVNSSETVAPTTGWSSASPVRTAGTFVWVRTVIFYGDGTTTTTSPALMTGNTGADGGAGPQGVPGPPGANGQQLYTWLKYADTPTTGMADVPDGKEYMGLAYNKTTATESSTYGDYQWSLTKGADGADGADGVPGPPGADGQPTYTWIRYADNISGGGISNSSVGKTHIGFAYNKTTATESNTPGDYEWSLIQGPPGGTGPTGVSVTSIVPYFYKVATGAGAPAQPVVDPPLSPWSTTEPGYTADTELYRTEKVSYSNATFSYTTVTKVSSYTAANEAMEEAQSKIKTYYVDGWVVGSDPPVRVGPTGAGIGDIWFQTDDFMHQFRWNGTWVAVQDRDIQLALDNTGINTGEIGNLTDEVNELKFLATSANNTADTADGRVSMSDYEPGTDDINYLQENTNTETGEVITTEVARKNGSIWFTRTRPRRNLCKNPSLETNDDGWNAYGCTIERHDHHDVPAGDWTLHVTNNATVGDHYVEWGIFAEDQVACTPGHTYTASQYAELISGTQGGLGAAMSIVWLDAVGAVLSLSIGDYQQLTLNAFDPDTLGTLAEPRLWVTGIAPAGAVTFYARIGMSSGNEGVEWHTGALLIEKQDDLGRYFDGDTVVEGVGPIAKWDGVPHASESSLDGDKILEIWELRDSSWVQKYLTSATIETLDAAKLVGTLDGELLTDDSIPPEKLTAQLVIASQALTQGDLVHVWNDVGEFRVRKACAHPDAKYEAHGFVLDTVASGVQVNVYHVGYDTNVNGLAPGNQWLSYTPGRSTGTPPQDPEALVQRVGFAPSSGALNFAPSQGIRII